MPKNPSSVERWEREVFSGLQPYRTKEMEIRCTGQAWEISLEHLVS